MRRLFIIIVCLIIGFPGFSQYEHFLSGAKSKAFSDASLTFTDNWSVFNNQAAMAFCEDVSIGLFAENRFGLKEINAGALAFVYPMKKGGSFGLSVYSFNQSSVFSRQKIGMAYGLKLAKNFSLGIQMNLIRTFSGEYGSGMAFCSELGLYYAITKKSSLGVHVFNPTSSKYNKAQNERIPTLMRIAYAYQIASTILLVGEIENNSMSDFSFKGGMEYDLSEKFSLLASFKSKPFVSALGLAFHGKKLDIHIALQYHQVLSVSPAISLDHYFN
jgi:hypothetical protein